MANEIKSSCSIEGIKELVENLRMVSDSADKVVRKALRSGAVIIRDEAKVRAPKKTGELAKNIKTSSVRQVKGDAYVNIGPAGKIFYACFQELGTSKQPAQPFLEPAMISKVNKVQDEMARIIKEGFEL